MNIHRIRWKLRNLPFAIKYNWQLKRERKRQAKANKAWLVTQHETKEANV